MASSDYDEADTVDQSLQSAADTNAMEDESPEVRDPERNSVGKAQESDEVQVLEESIAPKLKTQQESAPVQMKDDSLTLKLNHTEAEKVPSYNGDTLSKEDKIDSEQITPSSQEIIAEQTTNSYQTPSPSQKPTDNNDYLAKNSSNAHDSSITYSSENDVRPKNTAATSNQILPNGSHSVRTRTMYEETAQRQAFSSSYTSPQVPPAYCLYI